MPVLKSACACPYVHTFAMLLLLPYARALPPSESEKHPNTDNSAMHHVIFWRPLARYHQRGMKPPSSSKGRGGTTCFSAQPAAFAPLALVPKYGPQEACSVSSGHHCIVSPDTLQGPSLQAGDPFVSRPQGMVTASFKLLPHATIVYYCTDGWMTYLVFCFILLHFDD